VIGGLGKVYSQTQHITGSFIDDREADRLLWKSGPVGMNELQIPMTNSNLI